MRRLLKAALLPRQFDGLRDALVGFDGGSAQIVQTPQDVVVPSARMREAQELLARVRTQKALPRESCSVRPPGPLSLRGNFGRGILAVSLIAAS